MAPGDWGYFLLYFFVLFNTLIRVRKEKDSIFN